MAEVSNAPRQGALTILFNPELKQTAFRVPRATSDLTSRFNAENLVWPQYNVSYREVLSCDNQSLVSQIVSRVQGEFVLDFLATSRELGWVFSWAYGAAGAPGAISANSAVWTLTIGAASGTYQIEIDGKVTEPIAFDALAAAIDAALEAKLGAGTITMGGTGPWTITGAGSLANTDLPPFRLLTAGLSGGTASTLVLTTPGGPARNSYAITLASGYQPPPLTLVFAYSTGTTGYRVSDAVLSSFTVTAEDSGLYRIQVTATHSGMLDYVTGLTIPACATPDTLETRRGKLLLGAIDATSKMATGTYTFGNDPQTDDAYTLDSPYAQRMERADRRTHAIAHEINEGVGDPVHALLTAAYPSPVEVDYSWQIGSASNGGTISAAQCDLKFAGTHQSFGGSTPRARVPITGDPKARTAASTRPVSITVVTTYADGYLATS